MFLPLSPGSCWYSFDWPQKHKRLSLPWRHQVVSNSRPLDWESSNLTTGTLLHKTLCLLPLMNSFNMSMNNPITVVWCSLEAKPWQQKLSWFQKILLKLHDDDSLDGERVRTNKFWTSSPKLLFNWLKH